MEQKKQLAALQAESLKDEKANNDKLLKEEAVKKIQQEALADDKAQSDQQILSAKAAANAGVLDELDSYCLIMLRLLFPESVCGVYPGYSILEGLYFTIICSSSFGEQ